MENQITTEQLSLIQITGCVLTETGAQFDSGIDFTDWIDAGRKLCKAGACLNWWLGDWINYGARSYGDRAQIAESVADEIGLGVEAIKNAAWVSSSVPKTTRVVSLQWSHHREVAPFKPKDQTHWLALANENKWSVSQLRQAIRASQAEVRDSESNGTAPTFSKWITDGMRWFRSHDVTKMPSDQREAIKKELKPIVELYERL